MAPKFCAFVQLLIITCLLQAFDLQSVPAADQCSAEEIAAIVREHSDLIDAKIANSSLIIQQQIADTKNKITQSAEFLQLQKVLSQIKATLANLKAEICTKKVQLQFDLRAFKIDVSESKCLAMSAQKEQKLQGKTDSALKKAQAIREKAALALQSCATMASGFGGGCSLVRTCCEQAVVKSTSKIDSKTSKIDGSIARAVSEQTECLRNVAIEALTIEDDMRGELIECALVGSAPASADEFVTVSETKTPPPDQTQAAMNDETSTAPDGLNGTDAAAKLALIGKESINDV